MLTLFSIPKPFVGHIAVIQRNALASWARLEPRCQVILFGDEAGIAEAAAEFGFEHSANIQRNELGTPLLDDLFATAQGRAVTPLVAYINTDIILTSDFTISADRVRTRFDRFIMVGQRTDLAITAPLDFGDGWEQSLRRRAAEQGRLHAPVGIDYFVFPRGTITQMPQFAVGRPGWDNWLLSDTQQRGIALVDATSSVLVVHQDHDYAHLRGALQERDAGTEAHRNRDLAGRFCFVYSIHNATWRLHDAQVKRALTFNHLRQRWRTFLRRWAWLEKSYRVLRTALRLGRKVADP